MLILPATIIYTSIQIGIVFLGSFRGEYSVIETRFITKGFTVALVSSSLAVLICCWDIVRKNLQRRSNTGFIRRKRVFNLCIIAMNLAYTAFLFVFIEFSKFSNIPIGRG